MSINYSSLLSKAWNITWKYKVLWFFGFLAAFGGVGWGNSGGWSTGPNFNFNNNTNSGNYQRGDYPRGDIPREWQSAVDQLSQIDLNTWITIGVVVVCSLLLLGLAFWLLSIIGRGGLIGGILAADSNDKVTFREAWNIGTKNFWRLFLIRMIRIIVSLMIGIIVFLPSLLIGILTCGLGFIPMICVGLVIGIMAKVWFVYMDYAVIMEKRGIGEAIGRAWSILRDNIGPIAILYIILFAVSLGVGLGLLILLAPAGVTIFLSLLPLITGSGSVNTALLVTGVVLLVLFIVASWAVHAVETVWETSVMVLAYREFIQRSPLPAAPMEAQPQITG
jgi:flagellar biosynthesis protein FliQ